MSNEQKHPHIHVSRYTPHAAGYAGYAAAVSPEDRSWTLFVPSDGGVPDLFVRAQVETTEGEEIEYITAEAYRELLAQTGPLVGA